MKGLIKRFHKDTFGSPARGFKSGGSGRVDLYLTIYGDTGTPWVWGDKKIEDRE